MCKPPADWDPELVRKGARNSMAAWFSGKGFPNADSVVGMARGFAAGF